MKNMTRSSTVATAKSLERLWHIVQNAHFLLLIMQQNLGRDETVTIDYPNLTLKVGRNIRIRDDFQLQGCLGLA